MDTQKNFVRNLGAIVLVLGVAGSVSAACGGNGSTTGDASTSTCNAPLSQCGAACTDLQSDPNNCGGCGTACKTENAEVCSKGTCALACGGGTTMCGASCFDTNVDPNNCGGCGTKCATGESCSQGKCGVACSSGLTLCGDAGSCVDTQSDNENCGTCGTTCAANQTCSAGACLANLVTAGPTDITGGLTSCSTGLAQSEHEAVMTDGHVLGIGMICSGTAYVTTSTNGGLSWNAPVSTGATTAAFFALAAAYGPTPAFYAALVDSSNNLLFSTSTDGGATWSTPAIIDTPVNTVEALRIDSYKGTAYISIHSASSAALHILRNGEGAGDAGVVDAGDAGFGITSIAINNAYGDVMVNQSNGDVWFSSDSPSFQLLQSTNGGATYSSIMTAPGTIYYSDWVLAHDTIFGGGWSELTQNTGAIYALPVSSITTPSFVGGLGFAQTQQYSIAADPSGTAYAASIESTGVRVSQIPFGIGESVSDAGVISDASIDAGSVTEALVSNATAATGPQIASRSKGAAVYAYTLSGRVYAGVKTF